MIVVELPFGTFRINGGEWSGGDPAMVARLDEETRETTIPFTFDGEDVARAGEACLRFGGRVVSMDPPDLEDGEIH